MPTFDQLAAVILGQGGTLLLLLACLVWAMQDRKRLQRICNRRTREYIMLIAKLGNIELPEIKDLAQIEDETSSGV